MPRLAASMLLFGGGEENGKYVQQRLKNDQIYN
jgi:hypothetical protein